MQAMSLVGWTMMYWRLQLLVVGFAFPSVGDFQACLGRFREKDKQVT